MEALFSELKGKTISSVHGFCAGSGEITFKTTDGDEYNMWHSQDCCEQVTVDDICGDAQDILDSEILLAEESTSDVNPEGVHPDFQESFTWTFYKLSTIKGSVTIRWYGESNGYYSESVDFEKVTNEIKNE